MKTSRAIKLAGSINKLSEALGVSRQVVQYWKRRLTIPEDRVAQLQQVKPEWFFGKPRKKPKEVFK